MKLRAFSCNRVLLRKNLSRYMPAMLIFGILMLMSVVLPTLTGLSILNGNKPLRDEALSIVSRIQYSTMTAFGMIYAPISAGCVFGYLHNRKSSYMLHAFPLSRECLFATNYASGFLLFLIPTAGNCLLSLLLPLLNGYFLPELLLVDLLSVLQFSFFYTLAVFCMQLSGKRSFAIICYFILNFLAPIVEGMFTLMIEPYLFGVDYSAMVVSKYLSPYVYFSAWTFTGSISLFALPWIYTLCLFIAAFALAVGAVQLYRRRPIECVGQSICFAKTAIVIHILLTVVIALFFGIVFYALTPISNQTFKLVCVVAAAFTGYMLLYKPLRRQKAFTLKSLLQFGALALVIVAADLIFRFDVLNIATYVPEPSEVASVCLNANSSLREVTTEDPTLIENLCALHEKLIEDYDHKADFYEFEYEKIGFTYRLKNGKTVERYYYLLEDIPSQKEVCELAYSIFDSSAFNGEYLNDLRERVINCEMDDNAQKLTKVQLDAVFDALHKDLSEPQDLYLDHLEDNGCRLLLEFTDEEGYARYSLCFDLPETAKNALDYLNTIRTESDIIR